MTTENINIVIREDGSRQVSTNLQTIATNGDSASHAMEGLSRALELVAAALAIDKLKDYADEWSSVTGIIEVATKTHVEAAAVLNDLFDAAQKIRAPIDDLAGLYGRVARAAGDLGSSQQQAIQFTKEVGQALVVQHTTATQASGAILQLGQLLGTGKIRAQEFNSVNENLAVVLQVVARNIDGAGGSVNKLKTLVEAGTVTSKSFFEAFLKGSAGLQADFDKSAFTIGQGFTLISNTIVHMVGDLNNATGASNVFGKAAQAVAAHMTDIEDALVATAKLLAIGTAAWVTYNAAQGVGAAVSATAAFLSEINAVANGTLVILGSAEAQRQKAVATQAAALAASQAAIAERGLAVAQAQSAVTAAEALTADAVSRQTLVEAARESAAAELSEATAAEVAAQRHLDAAKSAGAMSFALAEARVATVELATAEAERNAALASFVERDAILVTSEEAVTAALVAQAEAQVVLTEVTVAGDASIVAANGALIASQGAVVAASTAAAGTTGRLAQVFALLRGAIAPVIEFIGELFVLINTNPIAVLITALVVVTGLLLGFGDKINAGIDSVTTLGDVMSVLKDRVSSAFTTLGTVISGFWAKFTDDGKNALGQVSTATATAATGYAASFQQAFATTQTGAARMLIIVARILDEILGLFAGLGGSIIGSLAFVWTTIANGAKLALVAIETVIQDFLNVQVAALNAVLTAVGKTAIPQITLPKPDVDLNALDNLGEKYADSFSTGFSQGILAEGGIIEKSLQSVLDDAQAKSAADREADKFALAAANNIDLNAKTKVAKVPIDPKEIAAATSALRELENKVAPTQGAVLQLAKDWQVLERAVKDGIITQDQANTVYGEATRFYRDVLDPIGAFNRALDQQNALQLVDVNNREATTQALALYMDMQKKNTPITLAAAAAERVRIQAGIDLARQVADQDALIESSVNARRNYAEQLTAIVTLLNDPGSGFTKGDGAQALLKIDPEVLSSTQTAIDAIKAQYDDLFNHIKELRTAGTIDETTAARLTVENAQRVQLQVTAAAAKAAQARLDLGTGSWADAQLAALAKVTNGFTTFTSGATVAFGDFFTSFTQGFADSVGKAVVESQNFGDALRTVSQQALEGLISQLVKMGIQYVINQALGVESAATVATAQTTAVAATTAAQVTGLTSTTIASTAAAGTTAAAWSPAAAIASIGSFGEAAAIGLVALTAAYFGAKALFGFQSGGFTGTGGVSDVAGVVHGQEFVVNAAATAKNRDLLEMLNAGKDVSVPAAVTKSSAGGTALNVAVHNYGSSKIEVQQLSPTDVRIIARDEVTKGAPRAVASDLANPNGSVSKAVTRHTTAQRSRN